MLRASSSSRTTRQFHGFVGVYDPNDNAYGPHIRVPSHNRDCRALSLVLLAAQRSSCRAQSRNGDGDVKSYYCLCNAKKDDALFAAIDTWCANSPAAIIIVAPPAFGCAAWIRERIKGLDYATPIELIEHTETHKRRKLCAGFKVAKTEYIIICDDDTRWTAGVLKNLLRPFLAHIELGCVFLDLRVDLVGEEFTVWERLGLLRHVGDGVDFHASLLIHGGVFCHHGSTAAYRASILQDASFVHAFTNDYWRGRLNSEDDQFLCRWLVNHDWKVALYSAEMRLVQTHSRASWRHMLQLLRWSRNDFRSSFAGLLWERKVWRRTPFTAWLRVVWMLRALAPFIEVLYMYSHPGDTRYCKFSAAD